MGGKIFVLATLSAIALGQTGPDTPFIRLRSEVWQVSIRKTSDGGAQVERVWAKCEEEWVNACYSDVDPVVRQMALRGTFRDGVPLAGEFQYCSSVRISRLPADLARQLVEPSTNAFCQAWGKRGSMPVQRVATAPVPRPAPVMPRPSPVMPRPSPVMPRPSPVMPRPAPVMPRPSPVMPRPAPRPAPLSDEFALEEAEAANLERLSDRSGDSELDRDDKKKRKKDKKKKEEPVQDTVTFEGRYMIIDIESLPEDE